MYIIIITQIFAICLGSCNINKLPDWLLIIIGWPIDTAHSAWAGPLSDTVHEKKNKYESVWLFRSASVRTAVHKFFYLLVYYCSLALQLNNRPIVISRFVTSISLPHPRNQIDSNWRNLAPLRWIIFFVAPTIVDHIRENRVRRFRFIFKIIVKTVTVGFPC